MDYQVKHSAIVTLGVIFIVGACLMLVWAIALLININSYGSYRTLQKKKEKLSNLDEEWNVLTSRIQGIEYERNQLRKEITETTIKTF